MGKAYSPQKTDRETKKAGAVLIVMSSHELGKDDGNFCPYCKLRYEQFGSSQQKSSTKQTQEHVLCHPGENDPAS